MTYKYIVYTRFNLQDNIFYPCMCETIDNGTVLEDSLILSNVYGLRDSAFKKFVVKKIMIRKENILYISEGEYIEEDLEQFETIQFDKGE